MTWAPIGRKWLPRHTGAPEPIEPGVEVCGVELERPLSRHHIAERWLARESDGTPRLAYRIDLVAGARSARSFRLAAEMLLPLRHEHLLPILRIETSRAGGRWIVCPYMGSSAGVVTLAEVLRQREDGRLRGSEVVWAMQQLMEAVACAHAAGHCHGRFRADEVALDRRGGVVVELYGLARRLRDLPAADLDARTGETRSVVELGYLLATGSEWSDEASAECRGRLRALGRGLGRWLEAGLVAREFVGAEEAREAIEGVIRGWGRLSERRRAG